MSMKPTGFEIPAEMKAFAEQSIEAARKAFHGYLDAAQRALETTESSTETTHTGDRDLGRKAMDFAEENVAVTFAFAEKLMKAKDSGELVRLQSEFSKAQIRRLTEQAKALGDAAAKTSMAAAKPRY